MSPSSATRSEPPPSITSTRPSPGLGDACLAEDVVLEAANSGDRALNAARPPYWRSGSRQTTRVRVLVERGRRSRSPGSLRLSPSHRQLEVRRPAASCRRRRPGRCMYRPAAPRSCPCSRTSRLRRRRRTSSCRSAGHPSARACRAGRASSDPGSRCRIRILNAAGLRTVTVTCVEPTFGHRVLVDRSCLRRQRPGRRPRRPGRG